MSLTKSQSSRINGAKSKGPRTAEGKQRSSRNAIQHGCFAVKLAVLENEDPEIHDSIYNALCEKFQPQDDLERDLLLQAANARFRLRRVWQLETSLFNLKMLDQRKWKAKQYKGLSEGDRQALAFKSLADDGRALSLAHRYEASLTRAYERAIADLLTARKAQKSPVPNEPEQPNENLPNEPTAPVEIRVNPHASAPEACHGTARVSKRSHEEVRLISGTTAPQNQPESHPQPSNIIEFKTGKEQQ